MKVLGYYIVESIEVRWHQIHYTLWNIPHFFQKCSPDQNSVQGWRKWVGVCPPKFWHTALLLYTCPFRFSDLAPSLQYSLLVIKKKQYILNFDRSWLNSTNTNFSRFYPTKPWTRSRALRHLHWCAKQCICRCYLWLFTLFTVLLSLLLEPSDSI